MSKCVIAKLRLDNPGTRLYVAPDGRLVRELNRAKMFGNVADAYRALARRSAYGVLFKNPECYTVRPVRPVREVVTYEEVYP